MTPLGSQPQCTGSGAGQVTSKFRCAHIGTCADILRRSQGTAKDGSYLIDPDGHGPVPAFNVQCDMINGGYMLVLYRVEGHKSLATDYVTDQSGGSHLRDDLWASIKPKYGKVLTKFSGSRLIGTQPEQMLLSDIETLQGARCVPWAKATNLGAAPLVKDAAACTGAAQASFMFGGTAGQPSTFFSGLGAPLYAGTDGRKRYNGTDAGARAWTVAEMWVMATPPPPPGTAAPPPPPIWAPLDQWAQQSNTMGHVGIGIRATTTKLVVEYKDVQLADQPYGNMLLDNRDSKADTQSAEWLRRGHTTPGTFAIFVDQNKGTSVAAQKMSLGVLVRTPKGNNLVLRGAKQIFDAPLSTKLMVLTIEFTPRDTTVTLFVEGRGTDSVIVPMSTTNGNSNVLDPRRSRLDTFYVGHQRFGSPVLHLNAQARVTYSTVPNIGAAAPPSPPAPLRPEWKLTPKGGLTCSSVQLTAKAQIRYERAGVPSGNKDRTVSVWFKPDCSKSGISNVLSWGHSRNPRQRFSIMYGRNCQTSGFAGQNMDWWGMPGPKKGAWTLHTYVYAAGQMRLYINGGSVVGGSSHGPKGLNLNTAPMDGKHPLVLGGNAFPRTDEPFGGSIFRVRIWDRALSAAEVADDFNMKTGAITKGLVVNIRHDNAGSIIDTLRAPTGMGVIKVGATSSINDAPPGCATIVVGPSPAPPPLGPSTTPTFAQMTKGGYKDGETGSQDWGNTGNCAGGDWSDKGTYWYQGPCNGGASWLTANGLAGSTDDYEFTVSIWNEDDDDSGVVWRYTDKQNYVRFHHTLNNAYNSGRKPALSGCQGLGSFVVVRKAGKETCLKTHNWKYTKGKWHTYKVVSSAKPGGAAKIYMDGALIADVKTGLTKGTVGIWQAHSQLRIKGFKYSVQKPVPPPPPPIAKPPVAPPPAPPTVGACKADTNSDGFTTMTDVLAVLGAEGMNDCTLQSDVSGDCLVTAKDLLMVLMEITEGCGCSNRGAGKPKLTSKGTFTCSCASGWGGAHCEKKKLSWAKPVVSTGAPGKVTTLSGETFYDGGPRPVCSVTFCRGLACRGRCHLKQEPIPWKTPAGCRSGVGCSACKPAQYSFWTGIGVSGKDRYAYGYCSKAQWIDGPAKQARYSNSSGIKVSPDGTYVVVADTQNHIIRKTDMRTGDVTTIAGGGDGKMKPGSGWLRGNPGYAEGAGTITSVIMIITSVIMIVTSVTMIITSAFMMTGRRCVHQDAGGHYRAMHDRRRDARETQQPLLHRRRQDADVFGIGTAGGRTSSYHGHRNRPDTHHRRRCVHRDFSYDLSEPCLYFGAALTVIHARHVGP
jgi:hypothetical protein